MSEASRRSHSVLPVLLGFAVVACLLLAVWVGSLSSEIERLEDELETARAELDGFRHAPDRLAARIDDALAVRALDSAQHYLALLVRYHPQTTEREEAETKLNALIAKIEAEEKAAEEKRLAEEKAAREREAKALRAMRKRVDDMRNAIFYKHPSSPRYVNEQTTLYFYRDAA